LMVNCGTTEVKQEPVVATDGVEQLNEQLLKMTVHNFKRNHSALSSEQYNSWKDKNLAAITTLVQNLPAGASLELTGHTDTTGTEKYNKNLSVKRAQYVADKLTGTGIAKSKLVVQGAGYSQTLPGEAGDSGKNRRVTFRVTK